MQLHEIKAPKGTNKTKRIVGRGPGSGAGQTAGRGENGQGARKGRGTVRGFQGGQMRLIRLLPKVGFRSKKPIVYQLVKLESLDKLKEGTVADAKLLKEKGLIKNEFKPYKILGNGEITKSITAHAYSVSKAARERIEKAGGKVEIIDVQKLKEQKTAKKSE